MLSRREMLLGSAWLPAGAWTDRISAAIPPLSTLPFFPVRPDQIAPLNAPSRITITQATEPGVPLVITGRVSDGRRPVKGASIFVYHTDNEGIYGSRTDDNGDKARLKGFLRTDSQGRYQYKTIRPGSYPNSRFLSHIHYAVHAQGFRDITPEFNFDDDPFMNDPGKREATQAMHRAIIKVAQDRQRVWHGVFDIVLTPG